jgi:hypothetical protein
MRHSSRPTAPFVRSRAPTTAPSPCTSANVRNRAIAAAVRRESKRRATGRRRRTVPLSPARRIARAGSRSPSAGRRTFLDRGGRGRASPPTLHRTSNRHRRETPYRPHRRWRGRDRDNMTKSLDMAADYVIKINGIWPIVSVRLTAVRWNFVARTGAFFFSSWPPQPKGRQGRP